MLWASPSEFTSTDRVIYLPPFFGWSRGKLGMSMVRSDPSLVDSRRRFLRYLALSPALASPLLIGSSVRKAFASNWAARTLDGSDSGVESIKSADQALNVMEFEELARKALPPAHFA